MKTVYNSPKKGTSTSRGLRVRLDSPTANLRTLLLHYRRRCIGLSIGGGNNSEPNGLRRIGQLYIKLPSEHTGNHRLWDGLDSRILREMLLDPVALTFQADVRGAYRKIGQRLGVTEDTVRNRVKAFEKGYLRGWRVGINPTILGYRTSSIDFDSRPVAKSESLRVMRTVPGMMLLKNYYGDYVGGLVAYRDEESLKEKLSLILRGTSNPGTVERVDVRFPNCDVKLLETDWEMVKALQRDPRRRYDEVAEQLRVSPRTVRRRLERMVEGRALFVVPDQNLRALRGVTKVDFRIGYTDPRVKHEVDRVLISSFDAYFSMPFFSDSDHASFCIFLPNIPMAEEMLARVRKIPGVREASMRILLDVVNLLEEFLRREVEDGRRAVEIEELRAA